MVPVAGFYNDGDKALGFAEGLVIWS